MQIHCKHEMKWQHTATRHHMQVGEKSLQNRDTVQCTHQVITQSHSRHSKAQTSSAVV